MADDGKAPMKGSAGSFKLVFDTERCSLCDMCFNMCPTGAIFTNLVENVIQLLYDGTKCVACGGDVYCEKHCPEDAVVVQYREEGDPPASEQRVLIESEMVACRECGTLFTPLRKVKHLIRAAKIEDHDYLYTCPPCRRKNLQMTF